MLAAFLLVAPLAHADTLTQKVQRFVCIFISCPQEEQPAVSPVPLVPQPPPAPQPLHRTITNPVVERIIETRVIAAQPQVTEHLLNERLLALTHDLNQRISQLATPSARQTDATHDSITRAFENLAKSLAKALTTASLTVTEALTAATAVIQSLTATTATVTDDLTVGGTLTANVLNVQGITSQGALIGPFVTATSTTATSTFAGGITGPGNFTLLQNGNVGVGTTKPKYKLHVEGAASSFVGTQFRNTDTTGYTTLMVGHDARALYLDYYNQNYAGTPGTLFDANRAAVFSSSQSAGLNLAAAGASGDIRLFSGGFGTAHERMRITSTGNLGIGTTSPARKLTVYSDSTAGVGQIRLGFSDANYWEIGRDNGVDGRFMFLENGTERVTIDNGGNVGIGTTTPQGKLYVSSGWSGVLPNATADDVVIESGSNTGLSLLAPDASTATLAFGTPGSTLSAFVRNNHNNDLFEIGTNNSSSDLVFLAGSASEKMRILDSGNVGIGTTNPGAKLHVVGGAGYAYVGISSDYVFRGGFSGDTRSEITNNSTLWGQGVSAGGIKLGITGSYGYIVGSETGNHLLLNPNAGNVGIGTTSPAGKLDIKADASNAGINSFRQPNNSGAFTGGSTGTWLGFSRASDATIFGGAIGVNNSNHLQINSAAGSGLVITASNGFVGVGGASGANRLGVFGNAAIGSSYTASAAPSNGLIVEGNVGIGTTSPASLVHVWNPSSLQGVRLDGQNISQYYSAEANPRYQLGNSNTPTAFGGLFFNSNGVTGTIAAQGAGVGMATTRQLALYTSNGSALTERVRVDGSGNVGIGTTSPSYLLDVYGQSTFAVANGVRLVGFNGGSDVQIRLMENASTGDVYGSSILRRASDNTLNFMRHSNSSAGVEALTILESNGNVGIGTTTPEAPMHVVSTAAANAAGQEALRLSGIQSSGTIGSGPYLSFTNSNNFVSGKIGAAAEGSSSYGLTLSTTPDSANLYERLRVTGTGNVGIGTTSPAALLNIYANLGITATSPHLKLSGTNGKNLKLGYDSTGNFAFIQSVEDSVAFRNLVLNASGGNIGIGTTSPSLKLHVYGNSATAAVLGVQNSNYSTAATGAGTFTQQNNGDITISHYGEGERMRITTAGNVGIGTTSPAAKLDVAGSIRVTNGQSLLSINAAGNGDSQLIGSGVSDIVKVGGNNTSGVDIYHHVTQVARFTASQSYITQGNVGIGTSTPGARLDIAGPGNNSPGQLKISSTNTNYASLSIWNGNTANTSNRNWQIATNYNLSGNLDFIASNSSTGDPSSLNAMSISNAGNVGIGTTSPQSALSVVSGSNSNTATFAYPNGTGEVRIIGSSASVQNLLFGSTDSQRQGGLLYSNPNNSLSFRTNGTSDRMVIDSSGNVGIGTTSPWKMFSVAGDIIGTNITATGTIAVLASGGGRTLNVSYTGGQGRVLTSGTDDLVLGANNTAVIRIESDGNAPVEDSLVIDAGNVGIGTTSPSAKLAVTGSGTGTGLAFNIADSNNSSKFTVLDNGNVGIGTTTPGAKLTVESGFIRTDGTSAYGLQLYRSGTAVGSVTAASNLLSFQTSNGNGFDFLSNGAASLVRITNTGNVGIGTTGPDAKLYVLGSKQTVGSYNYGVLTVADDTALAANVGGAIAFQGKYTSAGAYATGASIAAYKTNATDGDNSFGLQFNTRNNGSAPAARMTIDNQGNVGIGTTNPSNFKLEVAGNVGPSANTMYNLGSTALRWGCIWTSDGSTGTCASDERLKENIRELTFDSTDRTAFQKVAALQLRTFSFRDDPEHNATLGLIAQEVENIAPELVVTNDDGYKAVRYGALPWLMLEALQELSAKINAILSQIAGFAEQFVTKELHAENVRANSGHFNELCVGSVCVTESQFMHVFGGGASQSAAAAAAPLNPPPEEPVSEEAAAEESEASAENTEQEAETPTEESNPAESQVAGEEGGEAPEDTGAGEGEML